MAAVTRRTLLGSILPGAAIATAGVATLGWTLMPDTAEALPLGAARINPLPDDPLLHKAQVVIVNPPYRRRRRRWVCWWHRGRRVCGWRWW